MGCNCDIKKRMAQMARDFQGDPVYLDYNATTPVDTRLLGDLDRIMRRQWGNPSSLHIMGGEAALWINKTLERASVYFDKPSDSFQFCSSGCEGISGILNSLALESKHMITTVAEHSVLLQSAPKLFPQNHTFLEIDSQGKFSLDKLDETLKSNPGAFLFYSPVNHETGAVQNIKEIFKLVVKRRGLVLLDAVQACSRLFPQEWAPYAHGFVISGHKFHVPKGIGMIQYDRSVKLKPTRFGGSDNASLFPGTANIPGIALIGRGLEFLGQDSRLNQKILENLTKEAESILKGAKREIIRESPPDSVPGILCISLPTLDEMENFFLHLAERRICISRFSACTGNVMEKSAILTAMGVPANRAARSLRLSFGKFTKRQDFFALREAINSYG
jgi:cysteine desulfurase